MDHIKPFANYLSLIWTRSAKMGETSTLYKNSIKQDSKLISIELSETRKVDWHVVDSECLNTIKTHDFKLLSSVTERGQKKVNPFGLIIDVRFGRSTRIILSQSLFHTSHCQWTGFIIIYAFKNTPTHVNGL